MATWLKAELTRRFKVPVKYVIYSHSHWDHASGGAVYADTARFIGQENLLKNIAMPPADTALPQNVRAQDTNGNGRIEREEAQGNIRAQFELYDANKDGALTGAEVARGPIANVRAPDVAYTDRINIYLGGKRWRSYRGRFRTRTITRSCGSSTARMSFSLPIGLPYDACRLVRLEKPKRPW